MDFIEYEFKEEHNEKEGKYYLHIRANKPFYHYNVGLGSIIISDRPVKSVNISWYSDKEIEKLKKKKRVQT